MTKVRMAISATAAVAAMALTALGAGQAGASGSEPGGVAVPTIHIRGNSLKTLHFDGPKTINEGEELRIVNESNPKLVGPQTFTLVEAEEIPQSKADREACMKAGHICRAILGWHRIKGDGPAKVNPVDAGVEGWDFGGTTKGKGDSWYTGRKPEASYEQAIDAGATIAPVTLTFISAYDPLLHGQIKVLPLR